MNKIVCASDLSVGSSRVVSVAGALSRALGWPLELFHAIQIPLVLTPDLLSDALISNLEDEAEAALEAQASTLRKKGIEITTMARAGLPDQIARRAREVQAGLLVLGTHARNGAARFFLGSVAEQTLRSAPCPTLVVPPQSLGRLAIGARLRVPLKVLVGIDRSPASDAALAWLKEFRRRSNCDARLVHLFSPQKEHELLGLDPPRLFEVDADVVAALTRELRVHVRAQFGTDLPLRIRPTWGGEDDPLAWEAETDDADLLVIGTSQTRRSTSLATVRGSHLPVLCVPNRRAWYAPC